MLVVAGVNNSDSDPLFFSLCSTCVNTILQISR